MHRTRHVLLCKNVSLALWDVACWVIAGALYLYLRSDALAGPAIDRLLWYTAAAVVAQLTIGLAMRIYLGGSRVGTFEDATNTAVAVVLTSVLAAAFCILFLDRYSRLTFFAVPAAALVLQLSGRWLVRSAARRRRRGVGGERALVYGAGTLGTHVARMNDQTSTPPFHIVGYIDDAPRNRYLRIRGYPVVGTGSDLAAQVTQREASVVIIAISDPGADFLRDVSAVCRAAGVRLIIVPEVNEMVGARMSLSQLREVDVTDLLGRGEVSTDLDDAADYINGAVVLITGAGGSIGSELARQVYKLGPRKLVLLDRDETLLHATQLSIYGKGLLDTDDMVLCDIRDAEALELVFARHEPEVVFHAAALKHLPMLEQYPDEGWKTNVLGTRNVLECAARHGVKNLVNISTDKAADPISVLGKSKRLAEQLTASYADAPDRRWVSVRFGNVLGSRGSVLFSIRKQIERGGPVTITHPQVTRYFMTIPEACVLVVEAGAIGESGDVMVLDMGEPVSIKGIAERLIADSGLPIDIVYTGLRPGEKLHEDLFAAAEGGDARPSGHPLITRVAVPPIDPADIEAHSCYHASLRVGTPTI